MDAGREGRDKLLAADTIGTVVEAEARYAKTGHSARVAHTRSRPAPGEIDKFVCGHLVYESPGVAVRGRPPVAGGAIRDRCVWFLSARSLASKLGVSAKKLGIHATDILPGYGHSKEPQKVHCHPR